MKQQQDPRAGQRCGGPPEQQFIEVESPAVPGLPVRVDRNSHHKENREQEKTFLLIKQIKSQQSGNDQQEDETVIEISQASHEDPAQQDPDRNGSNAVPRCFPVIADPVRELDDEQERFKKNVVDSKYIKFEKGERQQNH